MTETHRELYASEPDVIDEVRFDSDTSHVIRGKGYRSPGTCACKVENTGNGFIAKFPSYNCTQQDYYVCLDYSQARDLVLGLSAFKKELGFQ